MVAAFIPRDRSMSDSLARVGIGRRAVRGAVAEGSAHTSASAISHAALVSEHARRAREPLSVEFFQRWRRVVA
jgi:hypothetical protein